MLNAVLLAVVFSGFATPPKVAQVAAESPAPAAATPEAAESPEATAATAPAADAATAAEAPKPVDDKKVRTDKEALLRAQAAGYKLVTKDGKEVLCKKEMVTGSRLATRTRCLTLAQIEEERNATKDMLLDMSRRTLNIPEE